MANSQYNFTVTQLDLEFILKQIKYAEQSNTTPTAAGPDGIVGTADDGSSSAANLANIITGGGSVTSAAVLPYGLRTVDGTWNNLLPGQERSGAADNIMPRLVALDLNTAQARPGGLFGPFGPPAGTAITSYTQTSGAVYDNQPRVASNLISDQTANNPAAVATALQMTGNFTFAQITAEALVIKGLNDTLQAAKVVLQAAAGAIVAAENVILGVTIDGNPATVVTPAMTAALTAAQDAYALLVAPTAAHAVAFDALQVKLTADGLAVSDNGTITVLNQSPDIGLSPAFNSWMTIFGQFFDHGLDLVSKGGNGTVYVPLLPDDPLYVPGSASNFMVLTRATQVNGPGPDGILLNDPNTAVNEAADNTSHETINSTTPFVDQNQTYTSHPSHQVFLREYALVADGPDTGTAQDVVATGRLLHGVHGEGTWADVKAQASQMLGIQLVDMDVHNVPLLATDRYGEFIRGANGFAQIVTTTGLVEGNPAANGGLGLLLPANTIRTDHAFLNDIAHGAAPGTYDANPDPSPAAVNLQPKIGDADLLVGSQPNPAYNANLPVGPNNSPVIEQAFNTYDNELLDRHFITGDGRGNENIGLTTVHTIFHSEHNRLVEDYKHTILQSGNLTLINEWLRAPLPVGTALPTTPAQVDAMVLALNTTNAWDGERLFQAGRFVTEMQYQHMVFEEFARAVQPGIDPFVFSNTPDIDPSIMAEFAHVVYRFGHSMLTEDITRINANMTTDDIGLIAAFLNPVEFDKNGAVTVHQAVGSIVRGMSRDTGNEIDEFVTEALRNNLVGLPLDLAVLNMARARDTGMPGFNAARAAFFAATGDSQLAPFNSWVDMVPELKNPTSIINFIAAYGTHSTILGAGTLAGKRAAATDLVFGTVGETPTQAADRQAFLNGGTDSSGNVWSAANSGLNDVDFWIGGLAERKNEFGGMLGATFNYVFEAQLEKLQNGDRFYYLSRTQGTNMLNELENNTFSKIVMRNSDLGDADSSHLNSLVFMTPDHILELDASKQIGGFASDPVEENPILQLLHPKVIRNNPNTPGLDTNYLRFTGGEHVVLGGTEGNDILRGGNGIDTLWGDGGNDRLDGGNEADQVHGGDGDDIITDAGTPVGGADFLHGDEGNDVISGGMGTDIVFGGGGNDFIIGGADFFEVFAGRGDDFVLGSSGPDGLMGNEGNDWIEGGDGLDGLSGENSELFFNSPIIGHDVLNGQGNDTDYDGESGDDIMIQTTGITRSNGMFGFDWASHKGDPVAADSDLGIPFFPAQQVFTLRDRFDSVEGLSGWNMNDTLTGAGVLKGAAGGVGAGPGNPVDESHLKAGNIGLIDGFEAFLGLAPGAAAAMAANTSVMDTTLGAEIIIGGGGSDKIQGNLGNDRLDGDVWLNTRIGITGVAGLTSAESMNDIKARMVTGEINPGQLRIVRELVSSTTAATDVDTAIFKGARSEYTISGLDANNKLIDANAWITVTHNILGLQTDGVDTIRHFERLQFADQTLNISTTNLNSIASGTVAIAGLSNFGGTPPVFAPTSLNPLTVAAATTFADLNGINQSTVLFTWQALVGGGGLGGGGSWTSLATGTSFTPTQAEVGLPMRLMLTFSDNAGVPETLLSPVTGPVANTNILPTGVPSIVNAPLATENVALSVSTSGIADGNTIVSGFSFVWNVDGVATGATGATFTPDDAQVGKQISVTASFTDGGGVTESVTSALTNAVINVNDAPVLLDVAPDQVTNARALFNFDLPTTIILNDLGDPVVVPIFFDADIPFGDSLAYSVTVNGAAAPTWLSINPATGAISGTPGDAQVGTYLISIQATDESLVPAAGPLEFSLTVASVNDTPVLDAIADITINEDALAGTLGTFGTATASDVNLDPLTFSITGAVGGVASIDPNTGAWAFAPALNFNGSASFDVTVDDGTGGANATTTQTVLVNVNPVNDAPTLEAIPQVTFDEGGSASGTAVGGDAADNNTSLTYSHGAAAFGTATVDIGTGAWSYTPTDVNFNGSDSFTITVNDGSGALNATTTQTVNVTVTAVNDAPVLAGAVALTVGEDSGTTNVSTGAIDVDGNVLTYSTSVAASNGTATVASNGVWSYTPNANFNGSDSFTVNVFDGTVNVQQVVSVQVTSVNDQPVMAATATVNIDEGATATGTPSASDAADNNTVLSFSVPATGAGAASNGTVTIINALTGEWEYVPTNANFNGSDHFTITVDDGSGAGNATATQVVTVNVGAVNDAPVSGGAASASGTEDEALINGAVPAASDIDLDPLTYRVVGTTPTGVTFRSDGTFDVAPSLADQGLDTGEFREVIFQYVANDGTVDSAPATVTVTINGVNDAPTGSVTISDATPDLNQTLSASNTLADVDGLGAISYQWEASADSGATWSNIAGATSANFLTTTAQVGQQLRVTASYSDGAGPLEAVSSAATAAVGAFNIINGTAVAETINGTALRDQINGNGGNDVLNGLGSNDELFGAAGNDILNGGLGADAMTGGAGDDIYVVDSVGDVVVELAGEGTDRVSSAIDYTLGADVENLTLIASAISGSGNALANSLIGNAAANTLFGDAGNDALNGGLGADSMAGGLGNDIYVVDNTGDVVTELVGEGTDLVNSAIDYTLGANLEHLTLIASAISGSGNALANSLIGNAAANTLFGDAGNDVLTAGAGADMLTGGVGADRFILATLADTGVGAGLRDIITDFVSGADKLQFTGIDANTGVALDQAFSMINTAAFGNVAGQLRYFVDGADTVLEGDVNGDGVADFQLQLTGNHTFVAADLLL
jgi:VCBS repeat-containing protein